MKLHIAVALGVLFLAGPLAAAPSATVDPPRDTANPATNVQLLVPSHGVGMNALMFRAAGAGPKPTMLLLHGLPGNERNLDLAQAVRRAGWNVLSFTYRGAWGSPGQFSIENAVADAKAAVAWLRTPEASEKFKVDSKRLVVAGHSMGGLAAALTASEDSGLAGTVLLDAWDIGATSDWMRSDPVKNRAAFVADTNDLGHALVGATAETLAGEVATKGSRWHLTHRAAGLARTPLLTIYASEGIAADNQALAAAVRKQAGARVTALELETDHAFADHRIALSQAVIDWLTALK